MHYHDDYQIIPHMNKNPFRHFVFFFCVCSLWRLSVPSLTLLQPNEFDTLYLFFFCSFECVYRVIYIYTKYMYIAYVNVFSTSEMEFAHLDNFSIPSYFSYPYTLIHENNYPRTATVISAQERIRENGRRPLNPRLSAFSDRNSSR